MTQAKLDEIRARLEAARAAGMPCETEEALLGEVERLKGPTLAKHQPCGCVICDCEGQERCFGCGAKHCGTHPFGEIPNPVYERNTWSDLQSDNDALRDIAGRMLGQLEEMKTACGCSPEDNCSTGPGKACNFCALRSEARTMGLGVK